MNASKQPQPTLLCMTLRLEQQKNIFSVILASTFVNCNFYILVIAK